MNITLDTSTTAVTAAAGAKLSGVRPAQEKQAEETTVQTRKYDTVELSDQAQQYLADESGTEEKTAEAQIISQTTDTSSDSVNTSELYSYTDDELSDLLAKGEITQLQYNTEMAKRGSTDESKQPRSVERRGILCNFDHLKYLFSRPSKAFPCLASSFAIS